MVSEANTRSNDFNLFAKQMVIMLFVIRRIVNLFLTVITFDRSLAFSLFYHRYSHNHRNNDNYYQNYHDWKDRHARLGFYLIYQAGFGAIRVLAGGTVRVTDAIGDFVAETILDTRPTIARTGIEVLVGVANPIAAGIGKSGNIHECRQLLGRVINVDIFCGRVVRDFQRQAEEKPPGLISEFIDFVLHNKKWWLIPIVVVLLGLGLLLLLGGTPLAPFIYTLF